MKKTISQITSNMKKCIVLLTLLSITIVTNAQDKKWEHSVNVGMGLALDNVEINKSTTESMFALNAGYGLNYYLKENWSVLTGVTFRRIAGYGLLVSYLDVPLALQYHVSADNSPWIFGLGPVFSYCIKNDEYSADHYVADGVAVIDQKRFKDFCLGLQPSIAYRLNRHWQIGVEGYIGLTNVRRSYDQQVGSEHLHSIIVTFGYIF